MDGLAALFGRDGELDEIDRRLRSRRLVTLVGPGGVGKTSTAREAARRAGARFPLGARFVDLSRVDDPAAVPGTFAAQLGASSFDALLASPVEHPALVLADNCEHVLDAAAATIAALLDGCELPSVLATSRSPLDVPGESLVSLAPLAVPSAGAADAASNPAVQLFLERASDAGIDTPADDLDVVLALVRRLDGLPLAIEIAAACTRAVSVRDLLTRMDEGLQVLDRPRFRGARRHRSLADAIEWSIALLPPGDADALESLAILRGTFTAEDARQLVLPPAHRPDVDRTLHALVHASLLSLADTDAAPSTYRLLEAVRVHGLTRLRARGGYAQVADRFADGVRARITSRLEMSDTPLDTALVRDLDAQFEDVTAALRWCVAQDEDPERALALSAALFAVVHQGRAPEVAELGRRVFERWPDVVDRRPPCWDGALAVLATAEYLSGHPTRAIQLAGRGLAGQREAGWPTVAFHRGIGQSRLALDDHPGAAAAFRAGAGAARRLGHTAMALVLELSHAQIVADTGDVPAALAAMTAARDEALAGGSDLVAVWSSTLLAWTTLRGAPDAGLALATAALDEARRIELPDAITGNLRTIAFAHLLLAHEATALEVVGDLLDEVRSRSSSASARMALDAAAAAAHAARHPDWEVLAATVAALPPATVLSGAASALRPLPPTAAAPLPLGDALRVATAIVAEPRAAASAPAAVGADRSALRRRGHAWELTYAGRSVVVTATKGLSDLAVLLAAEGREVHCLELAGAGVEQASTGDVIDARARRAYEQRLRDLKDEIDDADSAQDLARAERARTEFQDLVEHLTASVGLSGRTRRATGTAERARSAVTHRLRAEMRRLEGLHPELAQHLRHSVRTGVYCAYAPERPTGWTVEAARP